MDEKVILEQFQLLMGAMENMSAQLNGNMDQLRGDMNQMRGDMNQMQGDMTELRDEVRSEIRTVNTRIDRLENRVNDISGDAAEKTFTLIEDKVEDAVVTSMDKVARSYMEEIATRAASKAVALTEHNADKKIGATLEAIAAQGERTNILEGDVENISAQLHIHEDRLDNLEAREA